MKMDIIEIKDKTLLPIKSVYYGPLESGQEATINVTPITCSGNSTTLFVIYSPYLSILRFSHKLFVPFTLKNELARIQKGNTLAFKSYLV